MTDWTEHIANLPHPDTDVMPERVGELTDAEVKAIRKEKKARSNRDWSGAAEAMVGRILESPRCFDVKALTKKDDRLQEVKGKDGRLRRFYANWKHPDFKFAALDVDGVHKTGYCEVKSCSPKSRSISMYATNTVGQIQYMDGLGAKHIKWWAFVFWSDVGKARVFILPHSDFMRIRNEGLVEKAVTDKRFKGKSLRRDTDFDLLREFEICKVGGKWIRPVDYWYATRP